MIKPVPGEAEGAEAASKASNAGGAGAESSAPTRSSSLVRGTDAGTAREGGETERAESVLSLGSAKTGTAIGRELQHSTLGEEITSVVRRFPRINFEKVSLLGALRASAGLTCSLAGSRRWSYLYGVALQSPLPPRDVHLPQKLSSLGGTHDRPGAQRRHHAQKSRLPPPKHSQAHGIAYAARIAFARAGVALLAR